MPRSIGKGQMAVDISKLIGPQWTFQSETAGTWGVKHLTVNAMVNVEKQIAEGHTAAEDIVRTLVESLCVARGEENEEALDRSPSADEIEAFTPDDLNEFAREFVAHSAYIKEAANLTKTPEQSDAEFAVALIREYMSIQRKEMSKIFADLNRSISGLQGSKNKGIQAVSDSLLKQTKGLQDIYRPSIGEQYMNKSYLEGIRPPPNPIHESNSHLRDMAQRLDHLVTFGENALGVMHGLQVAAAEFLENFSSEAGKNSKAASKAIWVGVLAVVLSFAQIIYTEYWRAPQDSLQMDAALRQVEDEINELQAALASSLADARVSDEKNEASILELIRNSQAGNEELEQRIVQLSEDRQKNDQAIINALEKLADMTRNSSN